MLAKNKIAQPNSNTKKLCGPLSTGGLMSQLGSSRVQLGWAGFFVDWVKNWPVLKVVKKNSTHPNPNTWWVGLSHGFWLTLKTLMLMLSCQNFHYLCLMSL